MEFKISLLENGRHSFIKGMRLYNAYILSNEKDAFLIKDAMMFLHHGFELLLKHILINEKGEHLIYSKLDDSILKKIIKAREDGISIFDLADPPNTINFITTIQRLKAFVVSSTISEDFLKSLLELNKLRNNIQHYGINCELSTVIMLIEGLVKQADSFFDKAGIDLGLIEKSNYLTDFENNLIREASKLRAGTFFKNLEIKEGTLHIYFYTTFDEYKESKQATGIDDKYFKNYWSTGKSVQKMLSEPIRMMKNFDSLEAVAITFGDGINIYKLAISKSDFESETGCSIEELKDSDRWREFVDEYIYKIKNPLRDEFFNKFVETNTINE